MNQVRSKHSKGFSGRNRKFRRFFRPKTGDLKKKRSSPKLQEIFLPKSQIPKIYPKNVAKSGVSPPKTLIWTSICAPVAPSLLISSGHSPRLGGTIFVWGAQAVIWGEHSPGMPPHGAGSSPSIVSQVTKRGACRNFAYYSMLIILSWQPQWGAMAQCPHLNTPLVVA